MLTKFIKTEFDPLLFSIFISTKHQFKLTKDRIKNSERYYSEAAFRESNKEKLTQYNFVRENGLSDDNIRAVAQLEREFDIKISIVEPIVTMVTKRDDKGKTRVFERRDFNRYKYSSTSESPNEITIFLDKANNE